MTIKAVEDAIRHTRSVIDEWNEPGTDHWLEIQTRYAVIDPIIRALGWDTSDPKQCYPEYHRPYNTGRVDYALLCDAEDLHDIGSGNVAPAIIIESKPVGADLDQNLDQLRGYIEAPPPMKTGVAVLTDGLKWRLYNVEGRGGLERKLIMEVDIKNGNRREAAQTLHEWLNRNRWRQLSGG